MKKFIMFVIATLVAMVSIVSCDSPSKKAELQRIAREQFVKDSIARVEFVKDSIAKAEHNAEIIKTHKALFIESKDEFRSYAWVKPKSAPKYTNRNGIYCYFKLENGKASNFRFVYQYYADEWLFIKNMIFNIDGQNITIVPEDMDTDCGYGGKIWEWCDEYVDGGTSEYSINEKFIKSIAYANSVKVKMNGRQYYDTRTLTSEQIKSIKDTYEYYLALGGKFI